MTIVSSFLTFPNISWWVQVAGAESVILDAGEHFQKMSWRNRYRISGANNPVLLSVPLLHGRSQQAPVAEVCIHNDSLWQVQHWRTLVSAYKRSPYFDHYEDSLRPLFEMKVDRLADFNWSTIEWVRKQLKMEFEIRETDVYQKEYPEGITDLRNMKQKPGNAPRYHQVFEDRLGFVPDLSILDLLFSEGPQTVNILKNNFF